MGMGIVIEMGGIWYEHPLPHISTMRLPTWWVQNAAIYQPIYRVINDKLNFTPVDSCADVLGLACVFYTRFLNRGVNLGLVNPRLVGYP